MKNIITLLVFLIVVVISAVAVRSNTLKGEANLGRLQGQLSAIKELPDMEQFDSEVIAERIRLNEKIQDAMSPGDWTWRNGDDNTTLLESLSVALLLAVCAVIWVIMEVIYYWGCEDAPTLIALDRLIDKQ